MCFGGGDTPQQPVNPAPYPYAEMTTKNVEPDPAAVIPEDTSQATTTPKAPKQGADTGANYDTLKM